jgi:hypothetical protein
MTDRHADTIASAIMATTDGPNMALAKVQGIALAWVFQTITDETGRRSLGGQPPSQIAHELRPIVEGIIDELDRWLTTANGVD